MLHRSVLAIIGGLAMASAMPAAAKDITVHMKNKGADGAMVFEPSFVKAAPGDVIHFQPTDPSHNAETISTMLPAGATPMKGAMNKEAVLTVSKPGLYGIKCMPHYSMGMVALVQVGKPTAADVTAAKAVKLPPFAAKRMNAALAQVK
ncbi:MULTISPECIES: pseudoazurin [Sphingobium]|jgi:pseudoazurin|uniref:Pseudoazurin n=1 Tax=Sphingobium yanoikuyae TaxID=13690 RepID=A0A085JZH4_SPHYA|nr:MULTISPECIES: pseudoazurin [Sphingobium]AYO78126.1 pseudoazurin [Sphingobium yanoikuyae]KFD25870.1 plasmid stabilization protein [Sphingobium yanoikuyae]KZC82693.1 plasmid stabilization protein [Sphingobium yanoikuyae]MBT2242103.1 pseudoazurin [Sphingobium sp. BHU LFT2]MDG2511768.1 pseudoazurin [Sphingobium yanoikuyae]